MTFINRQGGLASGKQLQSALAKHDASLKGEALDTALANALTRLRLKKAIERTGDTWSLVGIGMMPAHA
jgi:hypothetical protein